MPFTLHGIPVSRGIAIGRAHMLARAALDVSHYLVDEDKLDAEVERLRCARAAVRGELVTLKRDLPADAPEEMGAFLDVHTMILDDALLSQVPETLIRTRRYNAEWALTTQLEELIRQFGEIEDEYLRERKADIEQVVERILKALAGAPALAPAPVAVGCDPDAGMIVVAHDIAPADMLQFRGQTFAGFVTDLGGRTSHTAIVARSLNIPAIVGLHHARSMIREGEPLIVDGREGVLIVNPGERVLGEYRERSRRIEIERHKLKRLRTARSATLDGAAVELQANIELPQDVEQAKEAGATGIGLFRSEFLFLNRDDLPSEDEQFEAYREVADAMGGRPVTIRTLDLGADKSINGADRGGPNPALGLRAIRFCLAEPQMFLTQLRAILRASRHGKIRLLIPMLAHAHEVEQTLTAVRHAKETLDDQKIRYEIGRAHV